MNQFMLILLLIFTQYTWSVFHSNDPEFSLSFPGTVEKKEKLIKTSIGEIKLKTVYCVSSVDSTDNELYLLNYYQIDDKMFLGDSAITKEDFLTSTIQNISKELGTEILYSNNSVKNNISVSTYRLEDDIKAMKGKIILTENYFFSLQVFTQKQYSLNKNMDKFLNSFYLNPKINLK